VAQLSSSEVLQKMMSGGIGYASAIRSLVNRDTGHMEIKEGLLIDFKRQFDRGSLSSVQETARDILAFSNTKGGVLLFGVDDGGAIVGHPATEPRSFRETVGKFTGNALFLRRVNRNLACPLVALVRSNKTILRSAAGERQEDVRKLCALHGKLTGPDNWWGQRED
jgi:hypothetical protein